jgi:hypothetical protein
LHIDIGEAEDYLKVTETLMDVSPAVGVKIELETGMLLDDGAHNDQGVGIGGLIVGALVGIGGSGGTVTIGGTLQGGGLSKEDKDRLGNIMNGVIAGLGGSLLIQNLINAATQSAQSNNPWVIYRDGKPPKAGEPPILKIRDVPNMNGTADILIDKNGIVQPGGGFGFVKNNQIVSSVFPQGASFTESPAVAGGYRNCQKIVVDEDTLGMMLAFGFVPVPDGRFGGNSNHVTLTNYVPMIHANYIRDLGTLGQLLTPCNNDMRPTR